MSEATLRPERKSIPQTRRAAVRYRCDQLPSRRIFVLESYQTVRGHILDLSEGGVGLLLPRPIPQGTLLFIDLMGMDIATEHLARVAHATPREDGQWLVGCQFEHPLDAGELSLILNASNSGVSR